MHHAAGCRLVRANRAYSTAPVAISGGTRGKGTGVGESAVGLPPGNVVAMVPVVKRDQPTPTSTVGTRIGAGRSTVPCGLDAVIPAADRLAGSPPS